MTDAEFKALVDAANARLATNIEQSVNKAKEDIRASFQECRTNLNARFAKAAQELGVNLGNPSASAGIVAESGSEHHRAAYHP